MDVGLLKGQDFAKPTKDSTKSAITDYIPQDKVEKAFINKCLYGEEGYVPGINKLVSSVQFVLSATQH